MQYLFTLAYGYLIGIKHILNQTLFPLFVLKLCAGMTIKYSNRKQLEESQIKALLLTSKILYISLVFTNTIIILHISMCTISISSYVKCLSCLIETYPSRTTSLLFWHLNYLFFWVIFWNHLFHP